MREEETPLKKLVKLLLVAVMLSGALGCKMVTPPHPPGLPPPPPVPVPAP